MCINIQLQRIGGDHSSKFLKGHFLPSPLDHSIPYQLLRCNSQRTVKENIWENGNMNEKAWNFSQRILPRRWGMRLTQCCCLHSWKSKPDQSIITKPVHFSRDRFVGVERRLKLLMRQKLQPRNSSGLFFSGLWGSRPPSITPPCPEISITLLET